MDNRPTPAQLRYLRRLAERSGRTFARPQTKHQASRQTQLLKAQGPEPRLSRDDALANWH